MGAGFVYCGDKIVKNVIPPYAGYQSAESHVTPPAITTNFETLEWHPNARRFESGNLNYNGILALSKGVELLLELGIDNIDAHVRELETRLREKIRSLPLKIVEPRDPKNWSGIVCVYYSLDFEEEVRAILVQHKIHATMRGGYIRFGIDFYNTPEQIDITFSSSASVPVSLSCSDDLGVSSKQALAVGGRSREQAPPPR